MSFSITIEPSGLQFNMQRDETILSAAIHANIGLPYGCKDGACGSCKCRLVEGRVIHGAHQAKALSATEEAQGWILTCCATPQTDLLIESRQVVSAGDFAIMKMPTRVISRTLLAPDVMQLSLQIPATSSFGFRAGQYIEFILKDGSRRSYSMANAPHTLRDPQAGGLELHLRHMPGGKFTDHVFLAMQDKEILRAEGPFGTFFLREESSKPIIFLASGTGLAPIKSMIEDMRHKGIERPTMVYWGGRRPIDLYLHDWLSQACSELPWLGYVPVLSNHLPNDNWQGRIGFVHQAVLDDLPDLSGHEVYACGAPVMVHAAQHDFVEKAGLEADAFYADAFTTEADKH